MDISSGVVVVSISRFLLNRIELKANSLWLASLLRAPTLFFENSSTSSPLGGVRGDKGASCGRYDSNPLPSRHQKTLVRRIIF